MVDCFVRAGKELFFPQGRNDGGVCEIERQLGATSAGFSGLIQTCSTPAHPHRHPLILANGIKLLRQRPEEFASCSGRVMLTWSVQQDAIHRLMHCPIQNIWKKKKEILRRPNIRGQRKFMEALILLCTSVRKWEVPAIAVNYDVIVLLSEFI